MARKPSQTPPFCAEEPYNQQGRAGARCHLITSRYTRYFGQLSLKIQSLVGSPPARIIRQPARIDIDIPISAETFAAARPLVGKRSP